MSQKLFVEKLRPASISRHALPDDDLSESQIRVLRAINGSLNWLSSQSRPDLSVQTSLSQQAFPKPKIRHLRDANNAIRRAKMHKDLVIRFKSIPPERLCICCHSDAAFANVGTHTQAGCWLLLTSPCMMAKCLHGHLYHGSRTGCLELSARRWAVRVKLLLQPLVPLSG